MATPVYSFTLPSLEDDLPLDVRVYHPKTVHEYPNRGAVLAHPYAPLGGCYDDHVLLSVTETLLVQGFVVVTFNFRYASQIHGRQIEGLFATRGAGDSQGKTSWTGRAEIEDYASIAGFLIWYLNVLQQSGIPSPEMLSTIPSVDDRVSSTAPESGSPNAAQPIKLLLGGYSYGSLVLARLPPASAIVTRFQEAPLGTAAAEIILRAQTLAKHTVQATEEARRSKRPRGRTLSDGKSTRIPSTRAKASPVTIGGEETDPSERRRSRDSHRSGDLVHKTVEIPRRVKAHIRRHSSAETKTSIKRQAEHQFRTAGTAPTVSAHYLLISPVVLPFTTMLLPPGSPSLAFTARKDPKEGSSGLLFLQHSTLAIFGTNDGFSSSRRLRGWAGKQARDSENSDFEWEQIQGAGHFWREDGAIEALQERLLLWAATL